MVQAPTARELLVKVILVAPAVAVSVPPQPFEATDTTFSPPGRLSVKFASVATVFPLAIPKVRRDEVFGVTVVGSKLLVMDGGCRMTMLVLNVTPSKVTDAELFAAEDPAWKVELADPLESKLTGCVGVMLAPDPAAKVTGRPLNAPRWPLSGAVAPLLS